MSHFSRAAKRCAISALTLIMYTETEPEAEIVIFPYKSYNYLENQCPFELSNYKKSTKNK